MRRGELKRDEFWFDWIFREVGSPLPSGRREAPGKPDDSPDQFIGAASAHFRIAKKALISGAGDLISTTTESSMASNPWRTPLGCRQTSPDPIMNSSEPTVDFTLPFTT